MPHKPVVESNGMIDWIQSMVAHRPTTAVWRGLVLIVIMAVPFVGPPFINSLISKNDDVMADKAAVGRHEQAIHDLQSWQTQQADMSKQIFASLRRIEDGQDQSNQRLSRLEAIAGQNH